MYYCQLKISAEAIRIIKKLNGEIPNNLTEALQEIESKEIQLQEIDACIEEKNA